MSAGLPTSPVRLRSARCEYDSLANCFDHTSSVGSAGTRDVKCGAMVDRRPNDGQTYRDVDASLETENLYWPVTLVVVHGDHSIIINSPNPSLK